MNRPTIILCLVLCLMPGLSEAQVIVNEWMAKNSTGIVDLDGDHTDWAELYNTGNTSINIGGYGLTDDADEPHKWVFPPLSIAPNEFVLVFCSGKNRLTPELHTNFQLSSSDTLLLSAPNGIPVHGVGIAMHVHDISEGSIVDGSAERMPFYRSTPGNSNLDGLAYAPIALSVPSGFYTDPFLLSAWTTETHSLHYTTDGSEPTPADPVWNGLVQIENRTGQAGAISTIPTTAPDLGEEVIWEPPVTDPFRGTVIRVRSFLGNEPTSHVTNAFYLVHPFGTARYNLPVVSLITDSLNLFAYDTGIYVPGLYHDLDPDGGWVWGTGNYMQEGDQWERPAHVQFFDDQGEIQLAQDVGIRIHGTGSRAYPQKSLRLYAREKYGEPDLKASLFPDHDQTEFDVLVLRNMGQDFVTGVAQDVLANRLATGLHQATLQARPYVVFINGEYWGMQNLRERFDKHFLARFHQLPKDSVDIIDDYYGTVNIGDNVAYFELYDFMESADLSSETDYQHVKTLMDVDDFMDNTLTRIYLGCYDWPGNNVRMWRERSPEGKFRWLLLDNDRCLGNASFNSLEHATDPDNTEWPNPQESTLFLRKLLKNESFREKFIQRMAELLNTNFERNRVAIQLTNLYNWYATGYNEHQDRWSPLDNGATLQENYQQIIDVVATRSCHVRQHFIDYFNLSESEFPFVCDSSDLFLSTPEQYDPQTALLIHPNPNQGIFSIAVPYQTTEHSVLRVFDIRGTLVHTLTLNEQAGEVVAVRLPATIGNGVYLIQLQASEQVYRAKMIIAQ